MTSNIKQTNKLEVYNNPRKLCRHISCKAKFCIIANYYRNIISDYLCGKISEYTNLLNSDSVAYEV